MILGMAQLNKLLHDAYRPHILQSSEEGARIARENEIRERERRTAMTPEARELEDLRRKVAALEERQRHARAALAGEDCGYGDG